MFPMRPDLKVVPRAPGLYEAKDAGVLKDFLKQLEKKIPHSDHIPSGVFHRPPGPSRSFAIAFKTLDYDDLNKKLQKIFKRMRGTCPWLIKHTFSSSTVWVNLEDEQNAWAALGLQSSDFENCYFIAEDFSYGAIFAVNGEKIHFFGEVLLKTIDSNRPLWPGFWKKSSPAR